MAKPTVGVCLKPNDREASEAVRTLVKGLTERHVETRFDEEAGRALGQPGLPRAELAGCVDLLVVLGGDGTLLAVARSIGDCAVPVLGVNLGRLGFLAEIHPDDQYQAIERALRGEMPIQERTRLDVCIEGPNAERDRFIALNEVVVGSSVSRLVDLETWADGRRVTTYRADGLIVSTPTGSTAYSLSAAGPILLPEVGALLLNPICPHTLSHRPLVLPDSIELEIRVRSVSRGSVRVTVDGQEGRDLEPGDAVRVRRSELPLRLVVSSEHDRFDVLRTKLGWGAE